MRLTYELFLLLISPTEARGGVLFKKLEDRDAASCTEAENFLNYLDRLLIEHNVVVVSDNVSDLSLAASRPGVLPIHVSPGGHPSLAEETWVTVSNIDELEPLFSGTLDSLVSLSRLTAESVGATFEQMKREFYLSIAHAGGLYIFGAGTIGRQVLQDCRIRGVVVLGFVDNDHTRLGQLVDGIPITNLSNLDKKNDVIVVSAGNHADSIFRQLQDRGFEHRINLSQFFFAIESPVQPEQGYLEDLEKNRIRWISLALLLDDDKSRQVIDAVVRHRLTLDTSPLAKVNDRGVLQWFDPAFVKPNEKAVFVDGGAFDGDTAEAFRRFNGPALRIHAFELDPEIAARASQRLESFPEVVVHALGLSDRREKLGFLRTGITDGRLDGACSGDEFSEVVSVDEIVLEAVTFLKLDVEGAEAKAIIGASHQIREHSPLIALAVYHKPSDPWALPLQVSRLNAAYRFYMRHYTDVAFETVVYAVME